MTTEARVTWVEDKRFVGQAASGHAIVIDGSTAKFGASPMELVLMGMAGCTAYDVLDILRKKRQSVSHLAVSARAERADDAPRVFTDIEIEYIVRGRRVEPRAVEAAIKLSKEKYCSASIMLGKTAAIRTTYRIEEEGSD
jgi:putative redox protein